MQPVRRAVIDVGTNSVKLLVADVSSQCVRPLWEGSQQTRLGQGLYSTHCLEPDAIKRTAAAVGEFVSRARNAGANSIRIFATCAARDARNAAELVSAVRAGCGLPLEIISGDQEAEWAFRGVTTNPALASGPLLLVDVGGGSMELILGQGDRKLFGQSFPVGTVRLLEKFPHSDPPISTELANVQEWLMTFFASEVQPRLALAAASDPGFSGATQSTAGTPPVAKLLVGSGGTASILGCMHLELTTFDRERLENVRLPRERVSWQVQRLWSLTLAERQSIVGLPRDRADVILMGTVIYEAIMRVCQLDELRISTRGLRFAAVMEST